MSKCLRCGAGSEWIKGNPPRDTSQADSLEMQLAAAEASAAQAWRIAMALAERDCIVSYGRQDGRDREPRYWSVRIKGRFKEYTTLQAALIAWDAEQQKDNP